MKASTKEQLREAAKLYAKTAARQGKEQLPVGKDYTGVIGSCTIGMSQNEQSPRLQVTWPITVTSPAEFEGREVEDYSGLQTENNIAYYKGRLEKIDVAIPDDIMDTADALDECEGLKIRFDVVKNEEFTNTYFRERIADAGKKPDGAEEAEEPEYTKKQLTSLGKKADRDDEEAVDELTAVAVVNNLKESEYDTWVELADAIIEELDL